MNTITNIKVWPLDKDGQPIAERPVYHSFPIEDGFWVIWRKDERWHAWFRKDDE